MPDVRAVLFDLDGVLVDSYEAWFHLLNHTAREFREADVQRSQFEQCWGQGIDADMETFFPGCSRRQVTDFYERHLLDFGEHIAVEEHAFETLRALQHAELPRAIITNTPTPLARDILAWAGLIGLVDLTVGATDERAPKPAPDSILVACRAFDVPPESTILVGDSEIDARAAAAAGARFVGFRNEHATSVSSLSEVVDLVLSDKNT